MPGAPRTFGYFGPEGTFTHQALLTVPGTRGAELTPYPTVAACLDGVRTGEVDAGLVPIDSQGRLDITANVGTCTVTLYVYGYTN